MDPLQHHLLLFLLERDDPLPQPTKTSYQHLLQLRQLLYGFFTYLFYDHYVDCFFVQKRSVTVTVNNFEDLRDDNANSEKMVLLTFNRITVIGNSALFLKDFSHKRFY